MFIIWEGAGGMVLIFGIISALLTNIVTSAIFNVDNYFADHAWAQAMSLWITGIASWLVGNYLNHKPPMKVRNRAGQIIECKTNHHLMFIPMQYWGLIFFALGILVLVLKVVRR